MSTALAVAGTGVAFAAAAPSRPSEAQWQQDIAAVAAPGNGCYQASYPALAWHAVHCQVAKPLPMEPAPLSHPATAGTPSVIGDGHDLSAVVNGKITVATGSFTNVSPNLTEKGQINDEGPQVANAYTLQLNAQFFKTTTCSKSSDPSKCQGWQQFIYESDDNELYMQYWLLDYAATCPSGWFTFSTDCFTNSPSVKFGGGLVTAKELGSIKFVGKATAGGSDTVSMSESGGTASLVSHPDTMVHLAAAWNTAEFNVFGDAGGGQANFGAKATYTVVTSVKGTSSAAPKCEVEGFTAETNNLTPITTAAISPNGTPRIASKQTDGAKSSVTCAVAPS